MLQQINNLPNRRLTKAKFNTMLLYYDGHLNNDSDISLLIDEVRYQQKKDPKYWDEPEMPSHLVEEASDTKTAAETAPIEEPAGDVTLTAQEFSNRRKK